MLIYFSSLIFQPRVSRTQIEVFFAVYICQWLRNSTATVQSTFTIRTDVSLSYLQRTSIVLSLSFPFPFYGLRLSNKKSQQSRQNAYSLPNRPAHCGAVRRATGLAPKRSKAASGRDVGRIYVALIDTNRKYE